jgi:hypothetical protein
MNGLAIVERPIGHRIKSFFTRAVDQELEQRSERSRSIRAFNEAEKIHWAPQEAGLVAGPAYVAVELIWACLGRLRSIPFAETGGPAFDAARNARCRKTVRLKRKTWPHFLS